jgi:hypothetical protein
MADPLDLKPTSTGTPDLRISEEVSMPTRLLQFTVWLTFFNTWVLFEETIVDRHGLWAYMPYYRVGKLCAWDIGAMALLAYGVWWLVRGRTQVTAR